MKMLKRWSNYVGAVMALLLVCGLALVLMMAGANFIQSFSIAALNKAGWTGQHTVQATFTASTIMNLYYITCGILFLGFFFLMEHRLVRTGVPRKLVLRRTFFTLGVELSILALLQLAVMTYAPVFLLHVGLAGFEILLGIGLIYLGRRKAAIFHA